jgi:hypothetical protein
VVHADLVVLARADMVPTTVPYPAAAMGIRAVVATGLLSLLVLGCSAPRAAFDAPLSDRLVLDLGQ